ncbi:MAG: hypothetical protein K0S74_1480 [Chlamydiales bacterium]|jgi:hypothetical protein|nr:hypothetical protein [Chlamydiales bacterium]
MNITSLLSHYVGDWAKHFGYQVEDNLKRQEIISDTNIRSIDIQKVIDSEKWCLSRSEPSIKTKPIKIRKINIDFDLEGESLGRQITGSLRKINAVRKSVVNWFNSFVENSQSFNPPLSVLTETKQINGVEYSHKVTREACIRDYIALTNAQIFRLENLINTTRKGKASLSLIESNYQEQITYYKQKRELALAYLEQTGEDWLRPDYFRNLIKSHFKANPSLHQLSAEQSFRNAMQAYLPVLVNCRYQELVIEGKKKAGFYRLGVISDMRNGWVSLKELKAMKADRHLLESKIEALTAKLELMEKERALSNKLFKIKKLNFSALDLQERSEKSISYDRQIASLKYALEELKGAWRSELVLDQSIIQRTRILQDKMLVLLTKQIESKTDLLSTHPASFKWFHLALLNTKADKLDKTGWKHDERVELEDMHEIFNEFNDKKIYFNSDGPYIDEQGIHLKIDENLAKTTINPLKLEAAVINVSVQGSTENSGSANALNEETIGKHPRLFIKHPEIENELLYCKKFNYKFAQTVALALLDDPSIALSMGCFGAKDRTGLTAELTIANLVEQSAGCKTSDNPFYKEIFHNSSLAHQVLNECITGQKENGKKAQTALKVWLWESLPVFPLKQKLSYFKKQIGDVLL